MTPFDRLRNYLWPKDPPPPPEPQPFRQPGVFDLYSYMGISDDE